MIQVFILYLIEAYKIITKIQRLQKDLIDISNEVIHIELLIQQKEKLYVELKNILARQPGPEVLEQIEVYKANLKEKNHQKKAMEAELQLYQRQVREYKYEIDRIDEKMDNLKKQYFDKMAQKRDINTSQSTNDTQNNQDEINNLNIDEEPSENFSNKEESTENLNKEELTENENLSQDKLNN